MRVLSYNPGDDYFFVDATWDEFRKLAGKYKIYTGGAGVEAEVEAAILKKYPPARVEIVPPPTSQAAPRPRPRPSTRPTEGDSSPVRP